jgi:hypothetical protein
MLYFLGCKGKATSSQDAIMPGLDTQSAEDSETPTKEPSYFDVPAERHGEHCGGCQYC